MKQLNQFPIRICLTMLPTILFLGAAHICRATWGEQVDSIHFNSGQPDFGTVPRRAVILGDSQLHGGGPDSENQCAGTALFTAAARDAELSPDHSDEIAEIREARDKRLRKSAAALIAQSKWQEAREVYSRLASENAWSGDLRDRVEILNETLGCLANARPNRLIQRYFQALNLTYKSDGEHENTALPMLSQIAADRDAGYLCPHALYQIASVCSEWFDYPKASLFYQRLLREYPCSPKTEAALIMVARDALLPETRDANREKAGAQALETLLRSYPRSRFRRAALGLQARVDFVNGRYQSAIRRYLDIGDMPSVQQTIEEMPPVQREPFHVGVLAGWLRKLDNADTFSRYELAARFTRDSVANLDADDAKRFVTRLHREPDLAAPYLYYRLYLCENKRSDLQHLSQLADNLANEYRHSPGLGLSPVIQVRLAEIAYEQHRYVDAIRWAQRANSRYGAEVPYDRALYVIGASQHKLGRDRPSIATFETLLRTCPTSALRFASHEELALLREVTGDEEGALSEYFVLGYRLDIAYFIDARMTIDQLAHFVAAHPRHPEHDMLTYSLGIRYLRVENWSEAHYYLMRVPRKNYARFGVAKDDNGYREWDSSDGPDPLKAVRKLSELKEAVARAPQGNKRASALYKYASFYYHSSKLLLYNAPLWNGRRSWNFSEFWNTGHATKADGDFTNAYMHDHETYARAERICRQIIREYPHSPTRPYAIYRAACCEGQLADFNGWWRADKKNHTRAAANLMAQLAREYPRNPLAPEAKKFARVWTAAADGTSFD